MDANEKYLNLLCKIEIAFEKSDVIKKQTKGINEWKYALCATPIQKNTGLILGINWGGNDKNYEISMSMPHGDDVKDYSFIKRSRFFLNDYLKINIDQPSFNYSNFCFFRSPKINSLSNKDISLCLPILEDYINYIEPPWILSLGVTIADFLSNNKKEEININPIEIDNYKGILGYKGKLFGYNYFILPHPNYPLKNIYRNEIWKTVFNNS